MEAIPELGLFLEVATPETARLEAGGTQVFASDRGGTQSVRQHAVDPDYCCCPKVSEISRNLSVSQSISAMTPGSEDLG